MWFAVHNCIHKTELSNSIYVKHFILIKRIILRCERVNLIFITIHHNDNKLYPRIFEHFPSHERYNDIFIVNSLTCEEWFWRRERKKFSYCNLNMNEMLMPKSFQLHISVISWALLFRSVMNKWVWCVSIALQLSFT